MTPPSYCGPEVTALCDRCGHVQLIPDPEAFGSDEPGSCGSCKRLTPKTVWRGPVSPIP